MPSPDEAVPPESPHDRKLLLAVIGAGIIGGGLYWGSTTILDGERRFANLASFATILAMGGGASCIGVYLVPGTDTRQRIRTLVLALLCGVLWKPVFQGAESWLRQAGEREASAEVEESIPGLEKSADTLPDMSPAQAAEKLAAAAHDAAALIDAASRLQSAETRTKAYDAVQKLVDAALATLPMAPESAVDALATVAEAAAQRGVPGLTRRAWDCIDPDTLRDLDPAVAAKVVAAANRRGESVERAASRGGDAYLATRVRQSTAAATVSTAARLRDTGAPADTKLLESLPTEGAVRKLQEAPQSKVRSPAPPPTLDDASIRKLSADPVELRRLLTERKLRTPQK